MADLLSLPIPTDTGFDVATPQLWWEPFNGLVWLTESGLNEDFDRVKWADQIRNLTRIVTEGTPEARRRATLRLAILNDIQGLDADQRTAFATAIWSRIDDQKNLPMDLGVRDNVVLRLPDTPGNLAKDRFRQYISSQDFRHFCERESGSEGQVQLKTQIRFETNPYIAEILGANAPLFSNELNDKKYIDWSTGEVVDLLKKAKVWWDNDKLSLRLNWDAMFGDFIVIAFLNLIDLLAEVVLPRLRDATAEDKAMAKDLVAEMEQYGLSTLLALPMTLFLDSESYESVAQKLRAGLNSMTVGDVAKSSFGLYLWLGYSSRGLIQSPPADLTAELINRLVSRRQPGLQYVIADVARIFKWMPETFNNDQLQSVYIGLEYLLAETTLVREDDMNSQWTSPIPLEEWAEYRLRASRLALQLEKFCTENDREPPEIVLRWKNESLNDRLPEVRRLWEEP
jgi:hypothetical protein